MTSDERGGGVVPGGASCTPGADNERGNGGVHFFPVGHFTQRPAAERRAGEALWAKTPEGGKAIYRATIRTGPQGSFCTAHVFQQIPGQNRIFMGWYSQGTQVFDFTENDDGTVDLREAGWFTPENANTWVSHIFKAERNRTGRSRTRARRATASCRARAAARSTSTRSRCRRRRSRSAGRRRARPSSR